MSIITTEQFDELADAYPELAQCYDLNHIHNLRDAAEETIDYTSRD
jgi:hypothetical protein